MLFRSAPPAAPDTGAIDSLRADLSASQARLDELAARLGSAEAGLRTLDTSVSQNTAALAEQPSDIGAVLQLPLVLSGLETAFAQGRPYEAELTALRSALPDVAVPAPVAQAAGAGLPRPDQVTARFEDVIPAMLAARPADPSGSWGEGTADWFRSALAIRPAGEVEGDTPEAIMSRLEAAVARRDFPAAGDLLADLPQPMQTGAGEVAAEIGTQAETQRFLETVRARALSGEITP